MRKSFAILLLFCPLLGIGQALLTPFEKSDGRRSATYFECIDFYKQLDQQSPLLSIKEMGMSDAGYPYHVLLYSNDGVADPAVWHQKGKVVFLINNGIHPGEPDGVDASMLLLRDLVTKKMHLPDNVALAVIPLYNIGGALNRTSFSRVNQNGPETYGFRGNAQNLDLNRDFTKCDSRNARSFARIFHWVNPDIQVDNHVSDGADYQYTMTLLSSQWNKLGGELGTFLHDVLQPALFAGMEKKGWGMTPYVDFEQGNPGKGWEGLYYDHSRPFEKPVRLYNYFTADVFATVPAAYIIPQGWHSVTDLLELNGVKMRRLTKDSVVKVTAYHIADYKSSPRPYEKHHKNTATTVRSDVESIQFLRGDYVIATNQPARRFLVEMLEPTGDDSYFAWNFFDAILQQKEGYSAYRWEDVAGPWLSEHPEGKALLEEKKKSDTVFAKHAAAQLDFVYKHSPWYEPAHLRYPVYRVD